MLKPEYIPGDIIYLKTDTEMLPRMVTAYKVSKDYISYEVVQGITVSWHYSIEITKEKIFLEQKKQPGFGN